MGAIQTICGQNILNKLMTQYGGDVLAFIAAQKSKLIIEEKFTELERKFHESFQDFQNTVKQLTEGKAHEITAAFQGLKNKANSLLPGGIASLERVKCQSINEFSGFNSLIAKIQSIKSEAMGNLSLKKQQITQKLNEQKSAMTESVEKSKPNIPLYEQIPEPLRKELFKQAEKKFTKELGSNETQLEGKIMGLFNASALHRMFSEMSPQGVLEKLLAEGFAMLERNVFANITGGTSGGVFGNIVGNIGNVGNIGSIGGGFGNMFGNILK